jgi:hypothetical protein
MRIVSRLTRKSCPAPFQENSAVSGIMRVGHASQPRPDSSTAGPPCKPSKNPPAFCSARFTPQQEAEAFSARKSSQSTSLRTQKYRFPSQIGNLFPGSPLNGSSQPEPLVKPVPTVPICLLRQALQSPLGRLRLLTADHPPFTPVHPGRCTRSRSLNPAPAQKKGPASPRGPACRFPLRAG